MRNRSQEQGLVMENEEALIVEAISFASTHGLVMVSRSDPKELVHAPFTLYPSGVPRSCFDFGCRLTPLFNALVDRLACDDTFLSSTLKETAEVDAFTGDLLRIYERNKGSMQLGRLGIMRFDYFVEKTDGQDRLSQVEMNTIAASFGSLSSRTSLLHRYVQTRSGKANGFMDNLPDNNTAENLATMLARGHDLYCKARSIPVDVEPIVAFIVQGGERNAFDQDILRNLLWTLRGIRSERITLCEISNSGVCEDGALRWKSLSSGKKFEITVAYFRAGYSPNDYPTEKEWQARELIDSSLCLACPSIAYQLVGTKKVQQELSRPGVVEKFVTDPEDASALRSAFVGQWSLGMSDEAETEKVVAQALKNPENFVLKPQREGGGNNMYGMELHQALSNMSARERAAYVLMQRIHPVEQPNVIIRKGAPIRTNCVGELGLFGFILVDVRGQQPSVVTNANGGFLLRSKAANVEDGGVAAGVAVLDSPLLT